MTISVTSPTKRQREYDRRRRESDRLLPIWVCQLGLVLKKARQSRGLSTRQVAEAAAVPQSTVCRYEAGQREPRAFNLAKIAHAIGAEAEIVRFFLRHPATDE